MRLFFLFSLVTHMHSYTALHLPSPLPQTDATLSQAFCPSCVLSMLNFSYMFVATEKEKTKRLTLLAIGVNAFTHTTCLCLQRNKTSPRLQRAKHKASNTRFGSGQVVVTSSGGHLNIL